MSFLGLPDLKRAQPPRPLDALRRTGTVVTVNTNGTVSVNLGGDTTNPLTLPYITSYNPTVGDVVVIVSTTDGDHIVLGSISTVGKHLYRYTGTYSQSIPTGSATALNGFSNTREETTLAASPKSSGVFTVPFDCWTRVHFQTDNMNTSATSRGFMSIRRTRSAANIAIGRNDRTNVNISSDLSTYAEAYVLAGDTIDFLLFQATGGSITMTGFLVVIFE